MNSSSGVPRRCMLQHKCTAFCAALHEAHVSFGNQHWTPYVQERLKAIKKNYGDKELGKVTVNMLIGGMRGIPVSS